MPKKVNDEIMDPDHCGRPIVGLMQLFLKVNGDSYPQLVAQPADKQSYPANLVILKGCVIESKEDMDESECWGAAGKVAEMCAEGLEAQRKTSPMNSLREDLAYAYSILCDYLRETEGDWLMSKETSETLIRGAIERLVWAGKCVDFNLDNYRSED